MGITELEQPDSDAEAQEEVKAIGIKPADSLEWGRPLQMGDLDSDDSASENDADIGQQLQVHTRGVIRVEDSVLEQATTLGHQFARGDSSNGRQKMCSECYVRNVMKD